MSPHVPGLGLLSPATGAVVAGLGLLAAGTVAYWLYTFAGAAWLFPHLRRRRQAASVLGLVLVVAGAATVAAERPEVLATAGLGLALFGYQWRRQWLWPLPARPLLAFTGTLPPGTCLAVLPDGRATPVAWLAQARVAVTADGVGLVHCSLARSLLAVAVPSGGQLAAELPTDTGFSLTGGGRRWDGVDGAGLDGHPDLARLPLLLLPKAAWRERYPLGQLLIPKGVSPDRLALRTAPPKLPGTDVPQAMAWGVVADGTWRPLAAWTDADPLTWQGVGGSREGVCDSAATAGYHLAWWAAHRRRIPAVSPSSTTA